MDGISDPSEGNHAVLRATRSLVNSKSLSRTSQHDGFDDTPQSIPSELCGIRRVEYGECDAGDLFQRFPV